MVDSLQELFVNVKSAKILVTLNNQSVENYASEISTHVDSTYSHTVRILHKLEDQGLVESRKQGRKKIVELTSEGEKIAEDLGELMHTLQEVAR